MTVTAGLRRVLQCVLADHHAGTQALRDRGPHVVLVKRVDERAAYLASDHGGSADAERQPWEEEVLEPSGRGLGERRVTKGRQPAELHREDDDQQHGEPEVRDGHGDARAHGDAAVPGRALVEPGHDPGRARPAGWPRPCRRPPR